MPLNLNLALVIGIVDYWKKNAIALNLAQEA